MLTFAFNNVNHPIFRRTTLLYSGCTEACRIHYSNPLTLHSFDHVIADDESTLHLDYDSSNNTDQLQYGPDEARSQCGASRVRNQKKVD
ncbi:hypothetical protein V6N12_018616 [Hibiscus sabdariffa]|uniref:Uncharacterized protein n=1 Tax=Hibiscus sabdariffa TaxID=183260 RepID=A0ABR2AK40_9ROSI